MVYSMYSTEKRYCVELVKIKITLFAISITSKHLLAALKDHGPSSGHCDSLTLTPVDLLISRLVIFFFFL